jgi:oligopeptide transport system permease protein
MTIEDTSEQRLRGVDTSGGVPPIPADANNAVGTIGPATTQSQLDLRADLREEITEGQSLSPFQASMRRLGRDKRAMFCLAVILLIIVGSYIGPFIYLHIGPTIHGGLTGTDIVPPEVYHVYTHQELLLADQPPSAAYPLGTDQLGRDILARLMAGVNVSIEVAFMVEVFDIGLGLLFGTLAGFFGGWLDMVLARFTDIMFAFPGLLFAILAAATLGSAFQDRFGLAGRLLLVSLAIGAVVWPLMMRYVRGQVLQLKEQQFVEAAYSVGSSNSRIIMQHLVPNLLSIVVVASTLNVVGTIIGEATISLLGLGVQPPGSSLGLMIFEASSRITISAGEVLWPSTVLAILVLSFSFLGDGIQSAFNPRTKD